MIREKLQSLTFNELYQNYLYNATSFCYLKCADVPFQFFNTIEEKKMFYSMF